MIYLFAYQLHKLKTQVNRITDRADKEFASLGIVSGFLKKGCFDEAIEITGNIISPATRAVALQSIILELVKADHTDKALELVDTVKDDDDVKNITLGKVALELVKIKHPFEKFVEKINSEVALRLFRAQWQRIIP